MIQILKQQKIIYNVFNTTKNTISKISKRSLKVRISFSDLVNILYYINKYIIRIIT